MGRRRPVHRGCQGTKASLPNYTLSLVTPLKLLPAGRLAAKPGAGALHHRRTAPRNSGSQRQNNWSLYFPHPLKLVYKGS